MGSKIVFFFSFAPKRHLGHSKIGTINVYIQLIKGYQNLYHMTLQDHPFVKKWEVKKFIFSDFRYLNGITGVICNGIKRWCVYYDRGSQEQS
jgi:hypothetical protein